MNSWLWWGMKSDLAKFSKEQHFRLIKNSNLILLIIIHVLFNIQLSIQL